jgi:hypothetical protein
MRVFILGAPLTIGGGNTEAIHTALLWRSMGIDVTWLRIERCSCDYASPVPTSKPWLNRLEEAGCNFLACTSGRLLDTPGLAGATVVAFCHRHAPHLWPELSGIGTRLVWSGCMTHVLPGEYPVFGTLPPTAVHYQSEYQKSQIHDFYDSCNVPSHRQFVIHGAFDQRWFPFQPNGFLPWNTSQNGNFVVGKISRGALSKWTHNLWPILSSVRDAGIPVQALCLGWSDEAEMVCGPPPAWAACYKPDTVSPQSILSRCHAMLCANRTDIENWPRVGLEAMSTGVPVVADNAGGWREMLQDGEYGCLCDSPAGFASSLIKLAKNDWYRQGMIGRAKSHLAYITNPLLLTDQWTSLFASLDK